MHDLCFILNLFKSYIDPDSFLENALNLIYEKDR